jgi:hypothetical protein
MKTDLLLLFTISALLASAFAQAPANVTNCTPADAKAQLNSVKLVPDPPAKGVNNIYASATLLETVTAATYNLTIDIASLKVFQRTHSVCGNDSFTLPLGMGSVSVQGLNCPASPGSVQVVQTITLNGAVQLRKLLKGDSAARKVGLPDANPIVTVSFNSEDSMGNPLICLIIQFPKV